mmetsp:Transcript_32469/g.37170  ORF Transcript_32469/g.37170 Transcript_32469/m.37170 type:complete len:116 (-) Transcript_32469:237-584(-)
MMLYLLVLFGSNFTLYYILLDNCTILYYSIIHSSSSFILRLVLFHSFIHSSSSFSFVHSSSSFHFQNVIPFSSSVLSSSLLLISSSSSSELVSGTLESNADVLVMPKLNRRDISS